MKKFLWLLPAIVMIASCKKTSTSNPVTGSPKLGSKWVFKYQEFDPSGTPTLTTNLTFTATAEQIHGTTKYLVLTEPVAPTVMQLAVKTDGLYEYDAAENLLCKYPAALNDTYNTINSGLPEAFTVKEVGSSVTVPYGTIAVNKYEGVQNGHLEDIISYNPSVWFAKVQEMDINPVGGALYIGSQLELISFTE